ncbi:MAG: sensor histidine kinase [Bacteroidales bacterium]
MQKNKTLTSYSNKKIIEEQQKIILQNEQRYRLIFGNIQDVYLIIGRQISENIHDQVAPLFATCKMYFSRAFEKNGNEQEQLELYNEGMSLLDEGIQNLRNISSELMSQVLINFGLEKALMQFIQKYSKIKNTQIYFNFNTKENRFEPVLENTLFRIVAELIHNSFKHSHASTIKVEIVQKENSLVVLFQDDGIGFDYNEEMIKSKNSQGLFSLTQRVKMLSGFIQFKRLKKGISFIIEVPIQ